MKRGKLERVAFTNGKSQGSFKNEKWNLSGGNRNRLPEEVESPKYLCGGVAVETQQKQWSNSFKS